MRKWIRFWQREARGFSVAEVTTILTALSILSAAAAPAVNEYIDEAKLIRARHDVRVIAVVLTRLFNDVGAERSGKTAWSSYDLLVGAGAPPATRGAGTGRWAAAVRDEGVGLLDDHLVTNAAGYTRRAPGMWFGWRGAYLQERVQPDPWGHRYAVNVRAMSNTYSYTVVLSAGPDGVVESLFETDGLPTAGDDIVAVVSSTGTGHGPRADR